jgi:hypothetical protein
MRIPTKLTISISKNYICRKKYTFSQPREVSQMEWIVEADINKGVEPEGCMIKCSCVVDVCIPYLPCQSIYCVP